MRFEYPFILLLLWLLPILCIGLYFLRRKKLQRAKQIVPGSISKLSGKLFYVQLTLLMLALALGIVALARPQWGMRTETVFVNGRNVAILVDVSRSMLAQDVHPNRLERSKADLVDLVAESAGERMSIIAFRSSARMLCPFTTDTAFLLETISGIGIDSAPRGETNIGQALEMALDVFPDGDTSHNAIILISDGEDLSGKAKSCAEKAAERGIPIFCVGIGDESGATIPQSLNDVATGGALKHDGETVVTKLDNKTLQAIANITKGAYIPLATAGTGKTTLGDVFNRYIKKLAAKELEEQHQAHYIERYQLFLLPAVICLLLVGILSKGRPGAGRRVAKKLSIVLLCVTSISMFADSATNVVESNVMQLKEVDPATEKSVSDSAYELSRKAQRNFNEKKFEEAAKLYDSAALDPEAKPEFLQDIYYNSGVAWLSCANFDSAIKSFELVTDADLLPLAKEAIGFAKYKQCISEIDAYNKNPENMDENGVPKDFEKTIKAKGEHIAKLNDVLKYYREASKLMLSKGNDISSLKASITAINKRLGELTAEKELFDLVVKHAGKPYELQIAELAKGIEEIYKLISPSVKSGVPNQVVNNSAARKLEDLFKQWSLGNTNISLQYFLGNGIVNGKFAEQKKNIPAELFGVIVKVLSEYKDLRVNPSNKLDALVEAEKALIAMQYTLSSPPTLLKHAIDYQTNACNNVVVENSLYTPVKNQQGAVVLGWGFLEQFPEWIKKLQTTEAKVFNEEIGGNCYDEKMLEQCKQVTPEALEEIATLSTSLRNLLNDFSDNLDDSATTLTEAQLVMSNESLELMKKIYALLFPQDQNQDQQQQNQNQQKQNQQDQQQNQKQNQQNQEQQQQENPQEQKSEEQKQEQEQQENQEQQQEEQKSEEQQAKEEEAQEQEAKAAEAKEKLDEKETQELLQRLLMQERERKEKKRKKEEFTPMNRNTRDW
ncbi:MAG: VWA domain-containing protein [Kiritimatiellae bacterium]|nr:VWA domain-containing protein [Kiritimatiellia bacterium]